MALYGGQVFAVDGRLKLTILVLLPTSLDIDQPFTILFVSLHSTSSSFASRFDVAIEKAADHGQDVSFSASHGDCLFTMRKREKALEFSAELNVGEVTQTQLAPLANYAPASQHPRNTHVYVQTPPNKHDAQGWSPVLLLLFGPPGNQVHHVLDIQPSGEITSKQGSLEIKQDGILSLSIETSESQRMQGDFHPSSDSVTLTSTGSTPTSSWDFHGLRFSPSSSSIYKNTGPIATINNDLHEVIQCTLQESSTPQGPVIAEASFGLAIGAAGLVMASATIAAAAPLTVPVILGTIGMVLAARSFVAAVDPPNDTVSSALYHGEQCMRQSASDNDVTILRAHVHRGVTLVFASYRLEKIGSGTLKVSEVLNNSRTTQTTLLRLILPYAQEIAVCRAISIPNLVPTNVGPSTSEDFSSITGSLARFSGESVSSYYAASDCFDGTLPQVQFAYSATESSYIMQGKHQDLGYSNEVQPLDTHPHSVLRLRNMVIRNAGEGQQFGSGKPRAIIDQNADWWGYNVTLAPHADPVVTGYKQPNKSTTLVPQVGTDVYFVVKDWIPYQAFRRCQ